MHINISVVIICRQFFSSVFSKILEMSSKVVHILNNAPVSIMYSYDAIVIIVIYIL
nr:MAG TPA: hypothetical protein [Caudoviricetes sp.]